MSETPLSQRPSKSSEIALWAVREAKRRRAARLGLAEFARTRLWIQDKQKQRRRLELNAAQLDYLNNHTHRDIILKARQLGFSTLVQADFLRMAVGQSVGTMTLSHDDDSTQRLRRMADFYYDNLPEPRPARKYANASVTTYPETNSEAAIGTAGSKNAGRSFTLTNLHGSEVAFWPDAETVITGAMQAGNPAVVLESTANGAQGYFYNLCMEALDGNSQWKLHFYPWWWDAEYRVELKPGEVVEYTDEEAALVEKHGLTAEQIKWRRVKQGELKGFFLQEYPEDPVTCFLLSGLGYFGDITNVRKVTPGSRTPNPEHRYYAGLDFAQTVDWLALSIIDATAGEEVDLLRVQRLPWEEMRRRCIERLKFWNVGNCAPESNSMGSTNIEAMISQMQAMDCKTTLNPFTTTNLTKAAMMNTLHESLHSGAMAVLDDPIRLKELRVYKSSQTSTGIWQLSAPDGEHDDTVMALGLAVQSITNQPAVLGEW